MTKPDVLHVTFDQNPSVEEVVRDKKPGDKLKLELHVTLKQAGAESADFTVEAVVPEGYEVAEDAEEPQTGAVSASDAMMTPTAMMVRKQQGHQEPDGDEQ